MEIGNGRDDFRLAQGDPPLFIKEAAAWTIPVSAGTCTDFRFPTVFTMDQGITQFPRLASHNGVHDGDFLLLYAMGNQIIRKVGAEEIP